MFEKLKDKSLSPSQERFDTIIGRTTQIYGRLVLLDSVRIDGKVVINSYERAITITSVKGCFKPYPITLVVWAA